jgi:hypothetical protein
LRPFERELGFLFLCNVFADSESPDDVSAIIAQRQLARENPGYSSIRPGFVLQFAEHRLSRANNSLLIFERASRVVGIEEIEIGFSLELLT